MTARGQLDILWKAMIGTALIVLGCWIVSQLYQAGALRVTTLFERLLG